MGRDVNRSWRPDGQRMDYPHIRFLTVGSRGSKYPQVDLVPPPPPSRPRRERVTAFNRWHVCTDRTTPECTAVGFFFAERVYNATGIPQGLLWNAWAGSTAREWIPQFGWSLRPELEKTAREVDAWYPHTETGRPAFKNAVEDIASWRLKAEEAVRLGHPFPYPQPMLPEPDDSGGKGRGTTILYNGRVHPLVPYAIAGILWYQGESDYANRGYLPQIEAMAESWRRLFAAPGERPSDLPFYFVQMQRCGTYMSPDIRDHQLESYFTIPNSGMAVLLDLDVQLHPGNKWDAGRRLALWALAERYGRDVAHSGPIYRGHRAEGNKVIVEFSFARGGLFIGKKNKLAPVERLPDGRLVNLEITADGRQWVPAESRIDGERLVVWADGVTRPTDVRYCWKSKADEPFLYNEAALPAAQFNTTTKYAVGKRDRRERDGAGEE
ncbi:MAG: sialate O-acetylesterase [Planctomycetota bacterium]|jgi:sialate O-acetylesterase